MMHQLVAGLLSVWRVSRSVVVGSSPVGLLTQR
jgi:hypothetical protein